MSSSPPYWFWKNTLNLKQIKKINKFILKNYDCLEDDKFKAKDENNNLKKHNKTLIINFLKINKFINFLIENCHRINKTHFGYKLWNYNNFDCNYNIYNSLKKDNYDWHIDSSNDPYSDIKLTILINLSEKNFEGGDFYLDYGNPFKVNELKEIGSMIMFKSNIKHMVTPVTSGERKNLAVFLIGPNFV